MNTKSFEVAGISYDVSTDGAAFMISQQGGNILFTQTVDQTKAPADAMTEVLAAANTFLVGQFPSLSGQFVAAFLALFDTLVITVTDGVPVIAIP